MGRVVGLLLMTGWSKEAKLSELPESAIRGGGRVATSDKFILLSFEVTRAPPCHS